LDAGAADEVKICGASATGPDAAEAEPEPEAPAPATKAEMTGTSGAQAAKACWKQLARALHMLPCTANNMHHSQEQLPTSIANHTKLHSSSLILFIQGGRLQHHSLCHWV
jgi:hypothetical protein